MRTHRDAKKWRIAAEDGRVWPLPIVDVDGKWQFIYPEDALVDWFDARCRMEHYVDGAWRGIRRRP